MPFYEYQCKTCGHITEELQKMSDPPLTICPDCGKEALEKIVSMTGFQLTGTGWYVTDFKDKKPQPATNTAEKSGETSKNNAPENKAESTAKETKTSD
jgi:putative FmdB family regulatory protein